MLRPRRASRVGLGAGGVGKRGTHGRTTGVVARVTGRAVGDEIWIEAEDDGLHFRWVFTDITDDAFHLSGMASEDPSGTWTLMQEMFAKPRGSG